MRKYNKYFDKELNTERYFDKNGDEILEGDYIKISAYAKPQRVYVYDDGCGGFGLGTDATNPAWIEKGRAVPCEYGVYPLTWEDLEECELVNENDV